MQACLLAPVGKCPFLKKQQDIHIALAVEETPADCGGKDTCNTNICLEVHSVHIVYKGNLCMFANVRSVAHEPFK